MNKMFSAVPTSALLIISYQNNVVLILKKAYRASAAFISH